MSAPTGAFRDTELARSLAAHYANAWARVPEGEVLLGAVARHVPSAPPTNATARCEEEDDGNEDLTMRPPRKARPFYFFNY